jgi:N utilization substance protein A
LASQLTGWDIDILTEEEESQRRTEEFRARSQTFIDALNVDNVIAHLLVTEGFTTVEDVAFVPLEELAEIEGLDEDLAGELRSRAQAFIDTRDEAFSRRRVELGVEDAVAEIEGLKPGVLAALGEQGVKTLDDLADLSTDELLEIAPSGTLTRERANAVIMAARAHWFAETETLSAEPGS